MKENVYYNTNIDGPVPPGTKSGPNGCINGVVNPIASQLLLKPGAEPILDQSTETTYVKGRLLGKVSR